MTDQQNPARRGSIGRPRLYLDVDGVLGAWGSDVEDFTKVTVATPGGRPIGVHYAPEMIERLKEIIEGSDVDLVWVTSWLQEGLILKLVDQLGLLQGGRLVTAATPRLSGGFSTRWKRRGSTRRHSACTSSAGRPQRLWWPCVMARGSRSFQTNERHGKRDYLQFGEEGEIDEFYCHSYP